MTAECLTTVAAASGADGEAAIERDAEKKDSEPERRTHSRLHRKVLRSLALLLFRLGLAAVIMAVWRIADDLGLPLAFVFPTGMFSHWQVWFGLAVLLLGSAGLVARRLRFGKAQDDQSADRAQAA